jgi:hypothetical protein
MNSLRIALLGSLLVACGDPELTEELCTTGELSCAGDGVYKCQADGSKTKEATCNNCVATPSPHCPAVDLCGTATDGTICDGDQVRNCATKTTAPCEIGHCITSNNKGICAADVGQPCFGNTTAGEVQLPCADGGALATNAACDYRTGLCTTAAYSCGNLETLQPNQVACDPATGDYFSKCNNGQPGAIICQGETACRNSTSITCFTPATEGAACGGQAVCAPFMHCTQNGPTQASCVSPAGALVCGASDRTLVCSSADTAFACLNGNVYRWNGLTTWGGSCASGHVTVPLGGNCIPGLADCATGLACERELYDKVGVCKTPAAGATAECVLTGQAIVSNNTCEFEWASCRDGHDYRVSCRGIRVGANVITQCRCLLDQQETGTFVGTDACAATNTQQLDSVANAKCGWDVTTTEATP